jgi:hypothetical protein
MYLQIFCEKILLKFYIFRIMRKLVLMKLQNANPFRAANNISSTGINNEKVFGLELILYHEFVVNHEK